MLLAIDADFLVYRGAFSAERTYYRFIDKEDKIHTFNTLLQFKAWQKANKITAKDGTLKKIKGLKGEGLARHYTRLSIQSILDKYPESEYILFLSSNKKKDFRYKAAKTLPYKGQRPEKPKYYSVCREYIEKYWNPVVVEYGEADDALAIIGTEKKNNVILIHIDKDIDQVEGIHYNPLKDIEYLIDATTAVKKLYTQLLVGDKAVDNIPGMKHICKLRTCGPVQVEKLLSKLTSKEDLEDAIYKHVMANCLKPITKEEYDIYFQEQMTLLYLCRSQQELNDLYQEYCSE